MTQELPETVFVGFREGNICAVMPYHIDEVTTESRPLSDPEVQAYLNKASAPTQSQVPEMVTMFQARAVLIQEGLFDAVDAYCKQTGGLVLQAWEYANHAYRNGAFINDIGPQFNLSAAQIDALFVAASQIEA